MHKSFSKKCSVLFTNGQYIVPFGSKNRPSYRVIWQSADEFLLYRKKLSVKHIELDSVQFLRKFHVGTHLFCGIGLCTLECLIINKQLRPMKSDHF